MSKARITLLVDLGFGDSGKGSWTSFFAETQKADAFIRFNGGCQAGHRVVLSNGFDHIYSSFSSGHHKADAITYLDSNVLISPERISLEAADLKRKGVSNPLDRLVIHKGCSIVTPFHVAANRLRERHRELTSSGHGSCGLGIGELMRMKTQDQTVLSLSDCLQTPQKITEILEAIRTELIESLTEALQFSYEIDHNVHLYLADLNDETISTDYANFLSKFIKSIAITDDDYLSTLVSSKEHIVFEPAQGILLDEFYGFYPYNTWSSTTTKNAETALSLIETIGASDIYRYGIIRTYMTRHGAGPFPTENPKFGLELTEPTNFNNAWQKEFRRGPIDLPLLQYALYANRLELDGLLISHMDHALQLTDSQGRIPVNRSYQQISSGRDLFQLHRKIKDPDSTSHFAELIDSLTPELQPVLLAALPQLLAQYLDVDISGLSYSPIATDKESFF